MKKKPFIDVKIQKLVEEFSEISGIETLASCQGHFKGDNAYIAFHADSSSLTNLVSRINIAWSLVYNREMWVEVEKDGGSFYYDVCVNACNFAKEGVTDLSFTFELNVDTDELRFKALKLIAIEMEILRREFGAENILPIERKKRIIQTSLSKRQKVKWYVQTPPDDIDPRVKIMYVSEHLSHIQWTPSVIKEVEKCFSCHFFCPSFFCAFWSDRPPMCPRLFSNCEFRLVDMENYKRWMRGDYNRSLEDEVEDALKKRKPS